MPTNRTRRTRQRVTRCGLTEDQEFYLKYGFVLDGFQPDFKHPRNSPMWHRPFESEQAIRQAWQENRELIMAIVDEPFKRPHGFWVFEAGDRIEYSGFFGCGPQGWSYYLDAEGLFNPEPTTWKESEMDYLTRHPELLTDEERRLLRTQNS